MTALQSVLWDPEEGARRRDEGMARASGAQGQAWQAWARDAITRLAEHLGEGFTADDLAYLAATENRQPAHRNAIGAAFNSAARAGIIRPAGMAMTDRAAGHRRRLLVWVKA